MAFTETEIGIRGYAYINRANEVNDNGELLLRLLQALHEALPRPCLLSGVGLSCFLGLLGILLDDPGEVNPADGCKALLLVAGIPAAAYTPGKHRVMGKRVNSRWI